MTWQLWAFTGVVVALSILAAVVGAAAARSDRGECE